MRVSETVLLELGIHLVEFGIAHLLLLDGEFLLPLLEVGLRLDLSLLLEFFNDIFSSPAAHVHKLSDLACVSVGFDSENLEG